MGVDPPCPQKKYSVGPIVPSYAIPCPLVESACMPTATAQMHKPKAKLVAAAMKQVIHDMIAGCLQI